MRPDPNPKEGTGVNAKKKVSAVLASALAFSMLSMAIALAAVNATPEVDRPNATMQLNNHKFKTVACAGEDGGGYETLRGHWKGTEADFTPGSTDYNLNGTLTINQVVWTINLGTGRGVLRSPITLFDPASALRIYSGRVTIITQGVPQPGIVVDGRGWIDAKTFDPPGTADGGSLLANLEVQINGNNLDLRGEFGEAPANFGFPDWSATTINRACP
jgi:hypothetical protein